ncbi:uncharacterized protein LOC123310458 [Coccinella septempunctata]|uniref:uncharacterized protein LOC123310458 n=1 Tax=Coccinella septempunctata TaxID=41139 RepID=UPI001D065BD2|nr:uncharacterized protein LOC123310458 [Coccinella septempunctata]
MWCLNLLLLLSVYIGQGTSLQCYHCAQDTINFVGDCMEGYCNLKPITCEANQTACYIYSFMEGYWDNIHFRRGCTDNPDNLCKNLKATKYISSICYICKDDKCNYMHVSETK